MTSVSTLTIEGKSYVILPAADYLELQQKATGEGDGLPEFPKPDANGNYPAVAYARVLMARDLIMQRRSLGWTQAQLAKASGVRVETVSRLELAKHSADPATVNKLHRAMGITTGVRAESGRKKRAAASK
jgi:DNA-binding XRE family transcriptional regulator